MKITWLPSTMEAPAHPDECADCGAWMNSKNIGRDKIARCVACHRKATR